MVLYVSLCNFGLMTTTLLASQWIPSDEPTNSKPAALRESIT
jgi:hypothetical protein